MSRTRPTSEALFARACELMPGGVNSPVRAFKGVGGTPVFIKRAAGAHIYDEDDRGYIDFIGSWGPMILGHAHPTVVEAVQEAAASGTSFGCPTRAENEFAELVIEMVPSVEMVRMVNSGTEATLSAIRLARGFTGRPRLLKFQGCYHGHGDSLLSDAGSGVATLGIPGTPGVLPEVAANTITAPYNDLDALEAAFARHGDQLAAVIVEPVAGNMGCVAPIPGFLEALRALCTKHGALLIFDEVMTGFRVAAGGAQQHYGVTPDITTLGKVIGGGLPVGAYGGRRDIMQHVAPAGPVYQAGTLSGNPLATAAGIATLTLLRDTPGLYERLDRIAASLSSGIQREADSYGIPLVSEQVGGMYGFYFSATPVTDYAGAKASNVARYNQFFHLMLDRGCYLAPSAFEASFIGVAHDEEVVAAALAAARESFAILAQS